MPTHPFEKDLRPITAQEARELTERIIRRHSSSVFFTVDEIADWNSFKNAKIDICNADPSGHSPVCDPVSFVLDEKEFNSRLPEILDNLLDESQVQSTDNNRIVYKLSADGACAVSDGQISKECERFINNTPVYVTAVAPVDQEEIDFVFEIEAVGERREIGYVELNTDFLRALGNLVFGAKILRAIEPEYRSGIENPKFDYRAHMPDNSEGIFFVEVIRHAEDDYEGKYYLHDQINVSNNASLVTQAVFEGSDSPQIRARLNSSIGSGEFEINMLPGAFQIPANGLGKEFPKFASDSNLGIGSFPGFTSKASIADGQSEWKLENVGFEKDMAIVQYGDRLLGQLRLTQRLTCEADSASPGVRMKIDPGFEVTAEIHGDLIESKFERDFPDWTLSENAELRVAPDSSWEAVAYSQENRILSLEHGEASLRSSSSPKVWQLKGGDGQCLEVINSDIDTEKSHPMEVANVQSCAESK